MKNLIQKPFRPKFIIGCDLSTHEADYSSATICKIIDGKLEVIDKKISKDSNEVKKFVETYEPDLSLSVEGETIEGINTSER